MELSARVISRIEVNDPRVARILQLPEASSALHS